EHPGRLGIDDQFELGGLLDRQVGRFLAFENPAGVDTDQMVLVGIGGSVAHQAPGSGEPAKLGDRGHCVACRQGGALSAPASEEGIGADHETAGSLLDKVANAVSNSRSLLAPSIRICSPRVRAAARRSRLLVSARMGLVGLMRSAMTVSPG